MVLLVKMKGRSKTQQRCESCPASTASIMDTTTQPQTLAILRNTTLSANLVESGGF